MVTIRKAAASTIAIPITKPMAVRSMIRLENGKVTASLMSERRWVDEKFYSPRNIQIRMKSAGPMTKLNR